MRRALALVLLGASLLACAAEPAQAPPAVALPSDAPLIPARLRRLSNAEYEMAASQLLAEKLDLSTLLPPDVRQEGFTLNADQPVPAAYATRLAELAEKLGREAVEQHLTRYAPCAKSPTEACADAFVERFAKRAFRRAPTQQELEALEALFETGSDDGRGFKGGAALVLSALLQSPSFLYVSELGTPAGPGRRALTSQEMAASLAFLVSGGPPDDELLSAAEQGRLTDPGQRAEQARRLLGQSETRYHFRRFVLEWLEVDELEQSAKTEEVSPEYERLKGHMLDETRAFVDEVMVHEGASLESLLTAGFASVDPTMARYYGFDAYGPRVRLAGSARLGLLQQASFLAAHAHEDSSSPVKRGDFVMRKLLCTTLPRPQELNIEVVIPAPDPKQTTRERFSAHVTNTSCQGCHAAIDPLGFTFENFDAAGKERARQNDKPVDTHAAVEIDGKLQHFRDSTELSRWLAASPEVNDCFARHAFRYFSAQSDPAVERSFITFLKRVPEAARTNLIELVVAYVTSDLFAFRGDPMRGGQQ